MYIIGIPKMTAHKIHRSLAGHHVHKGKIRNPENAVIDWECARLTKPDKQMTARETFEKLYSNVEGIEDILNKFKL